MKGMLSIASHKPIRVVVRKFLKCDMIELDQPAAEEVQKGKQPAFTQVTEPVQAEVAYALEGDRATMKANRVGTEGQDPGLRTLLILYGPSRKGAKGAIDGIEMDEGYNGHSVNQIRDLSLVSQPLGFHLVFKQAFLMQVVSNDIHLGQLLHCSYGRYFLLYEVYNSLRFDRGPWLVAYAEVSKLYEPMHPPP
ncbi:hypothetical protein FNV43_RR07374 [Rhamnella rubrinervis]|uniref:Uncharacterized protein n=1 Tax=Rhamnella rubrinervis TaxID=2594499 RepID=A0A8K0MMC3_9ROSA|nr:hypothetical protein FNV43_RR07374 [Rhamnella rubrinervis]